MSLAESKRPEVNISSLDCVTGRATDSGGMWDRAFLRETHTVSVETERQTRNDPHTDQGNTAGDTRGSGVAFYVPHPQEYCRGSASSGRSPHTHVCLIFLPIEDSQQGRVLTTPEVQGHIVDGSSCGEEAGPVRDG